MPGSGRLGTPGLLASVWLRNGGPPRSPRHSAVVDNTLRAHSLTPVLEPPEAAVRPTVGSARRRLLSARAPAFPRLGG